MGNLRLAIFDLDGTLLDSSAWLLRAVNEVLAPYQPRPWGRYELVQTAGAPERSVFSRVVPLRDLDNVLAAYRRALDSTGLLRVQPGVTTMLDTLANAGIELALFSGAGRELGELRLRNVGWQKRFSISVWGDEVAPKPLPAGIFEVLRRSRRTPDEAVYVGDTDKDGKCAKAAGVRFFGVAWGDVTGGPRGGRVARTPQELLEWLLRLAPNLEAGPP